MRLLFLDPSSCSISWHIFFRKCHSVPRLFLYLDGLDNYVRINRELMRYPAFPYICPNHTCGIKKRFIALTLIFLYKNANYPRQ